MKPGPKPKPTAQKLAEGNPGKRRINENEPKPDAMPASMIGNPPEHLTDVGAAKWRELTKQLEASRVLTVLDADLLTLYCELTQDYAALVAEIEADGLVLTGEKGGKYANPAWNMAHATRSMMLKIMAELGMTPSGRTRLTVPEPKQKSKLDKYRGKTT